MSLAPYHALAPCQELGAAVLEGPLWKPELRLVERIVSSHMKRHVALSRSRPQPVGQFPLARAASARFALEGFAFHQLLLAGRIGAVNIRVDAVLAFDRVSLPSPGSHWNTSLPAPAAQTAVHLFGDFLQIS